jgi:hypothetical protein
MAGTRRPRDQLFRKSDLVRALRAAQTAGIPNPRVQIDRHGTITIVSGALPETADHNPWLSDLDKVKK